MAVDGLRGGPMSSGTSQTHVVVVGGGFAGIACARRLAAEPSARVTLLDQNGRHDFQPLLYQVATAELTPDDIRFDLTEVFRPDERVTVHTGDAIGLDPDSGTLTLADGDELTGDVVVLAAGARPNFYHTPGAAEFSYPLYSLDDAQRLRHRVLGLFDEAAAKPELVDEGALTLVVVGGGCTGVEVAGALAELAHDIMPHVHPQLAVGAAQVILVDPGHALLAPFSDESHQYAARQLQRRGVQVRLGVAAKELTATSVALSDGTTVPTHLVVWGGGEQAAGVAAQSGLAQGRGGRIDVQPDLTVAGHPRIYAVGDIANIPFGDEAALPQLGSVAAQSGAWAGANIVADIERRGRTPFHYRDKGIMAMLGRKAAVAEIGPHRHELHGRFAFAAWLGVHAELLANVGAELRAFTAWAEEFYLRPHHRSAKLLDPALIDEPRIGWHAKPEEST
jgi:NADH:ubiquinone reductase (H+-translocating)